MLSSLLLLTTALLAAVGVDAKFVLAHFMLANGAGYSASDWARDIQAAQASHIQGFVINFAQDLQLDASIDAAFQAAASLSFRLIFSFDYAAAGGWDAGRISGYIKKYGPNPAYLKTGDKTDGLPVVSTFAGDGQAGDWAGIKAASACFLIPNWQPGAGGPFDGLFSWDAWPAGPQGKDTSKDAAYQSALGGKPYMMPVSPWFYTNVPTWNKNWYMGGDNLWFDRWQQIIQLQPEYVQIISWNDWPESHYIGPLGSNAAFSDVFKAGSAPFNYADKMPHDGFRATLPFWIDKYLGKSPAVPKQTISFWYRLSPKDACASGGTQGLGANNSPQFTPSQLTQDAVFYDALLTGPADVYVSIGGSEVQGTWSSVPRLGAGVYHGSVPFNGRTGEVKIRLAANNGTVLSQTGPAISTTCAGGITNWNAWSGSGTA